MSDEIKNIKPSEFYEKYWKIDYGDGKLVSPPQLSQAEKDFLDSNFPPHPLPAKLIGEVKK